VAPKSPPVSISLPAAPSASSFIAPPSKARLMAGR
jgi:hypothetical protein